VKRALSVYERVENMQEKDYEKTPCGDFTFNLKSGINIPTSPRPSEEHEARIVSSLDDE
jgi:hypothetical protein